MEFFPFFLCWYLWFLSCRHAMSSSHICFSTLSSGVRPDLLAVFCFLVLYSKSHISLDLSFSFTFAYFHWYHDVLSSIISFCNPHCSAMLIQHSVFSIPSISSSQSFALAYLSQLLSFFGSTLHLSHLLHSSSWFLYILLCIFYCINVLSFGFHSSLQCFF